MVTVIRWVTDTIRPYPDYGRRLHTGLPQRLVRMRRWRRFPHKTPIGKSVCHTPSPYNESEPSRHYPFVQAHGSKKAYDADHYAMLHVRQHTHTCSFRGHCFYLNGFHFSYVCRPVSPCGALPPLFFMQSIISIQSLFARSWLTRRYGVFFGIRAKKSPQFPVVGSIFLCKCRTPLCSRRAAGSTSEQTSNSDYTH